jgi:phosphoribosylanthranilate isomerase
MSALFRIKICGITNVADARMAAAAGADAIGLNFYAQSPRFVSRDVAHEIAAALPAGVAKVGVFVNASVADMAATADALALNYVQLHGDEPPALLAELDSHAIIRAFRCRDGDGRIVLDYLADCARVGVHPAAVLLDAHVAGQFGGTGAKLDWAAVHNLQRSLEDIPVLLAGGLTADNVAAAIAEARPHGLDAASGVESSPGKKDARLIEQFVAEARRAFAAN